MKLELPVPRALNRLADILLAENIIAPQAINFALTWLAGARMVVTGGVPGVSQVSALSDEAGWNAIAQAGLPMSAPFRWMLREKQPNAGATRMATSVVEELVADMGTQPWDVMPGLAAIAARYRDADFGINESAAALMLESLGAPNGTVWIPFDDSGSLTIQALRRGWQVNAAQMMGIRSESTLPLLLAIESGEAAPEKVSMDVVRDPSGRPLTRAQYVLACPPIGAPLRESKLLQWASETSAPLERNARSESWLVRELIQRTDEKAVFLLPPSILFSSGQDERLREFLLKRAGDVCELQSVTSLPNGALNSASIAMAVVVVTPGQHNERIRMVSLSETEKGATLKSHLEQHWDVALGRVEDPSRSISIRRDEISATDLCLTPSRYLRRTVSIGPNAAPLGELCSMVRPPVTVKDERGQEVFELGIPELKSWGPVGHTLEKQTRIREKAVIEGIEPGDVVLSVKGTVGKAGLVGAALKYPAVIPSQSCISLRIKSSATENISSQYLLMFLRSEMGQAQLKTLQIGMTVPQVNPNTLLRDFLVPVPDRALQAEVEAEYERLCQLESQVTALTKEMGTLAASRWSTAPSDPYSRG